MPTVTSRRAKPSPKKLAHRSALCREILEIDRKCEADIARRKEIETELKLIATAAEDSFREDVAKLGSVTVAPAKAGEFKGNVPQIQTEKWLELPPAEKKRLEKTGLVKIEPQWGSKSYGKVTVKLSS